MNFSYLKTKILIILFLVSLFAATGCNCSESMWAGLNNGDIFDEPEDVLDEMLDNLGKSDLRVIRIIIDFRLEIDDDGNTLPVGDYNDCILEQIDDLMAKAKEKGILLLITLQSHNWIKYETFTIDQDFYEWRNCKTPVNIYQLSLTDGPQEITTPYAQRGWQNDYLTNLDAKNAYKQRVNHILNHVNPYFNRPWKDINDVIWAWGLQGEPEHLLPSPSNINDLKDWLNEMATYVKSIDPDTYIALGTKEYDEDLGNIEDADIYTISLYSWERPWNDPAYYIDDFNSKIGEPYGKLFLVQEFNNGYSHTPGSTENEKNFEDKIEILRTKKVPWMFWEHGYNFDTDDIWYANKTTDPDNYPDGIFWGAKLYPAARKIWGTIWDTDAIGKKWKVHDMADALCSEPGSSCDESVKVHLLDIFSNNSINSGYTWYDEKPVGSNDSYQSLNGYLKIVAGLGQDLWGGTPEKKGAPMLLRAAPNYDYWIETFVTADPVSAPSQPINTQIGLFVYEDEDNWIFFGLTNHNFTINNATTRGDGLIVTTTDNDVSAIVEEMALTKDFAFIKIDKTGDIWEFYWKLEHTEDWDLLTTVELHLSEPEIGMGAKTFDFTHPQLYGPVTANYDYFMIGKK